MEYMLIYSSIPYLNWKRSTFSLEILLYSSNYLSFIYIITCYSINPEWIFKLLQKKKIFLPHFSRNTLKMDIKSIFFVLWIFWTKIVHLCFKNTFFVMTILNQNWMGVINKMAPLNSKSNLISKEIKIIT